MQRAGLLAASLALLSAASVHAQKDASRVEALAPLLMAEDRRAYDDTLFAHALTNPDPLVRRTAVLAIGRIGDRRGTRLLLPLLADRDSTVPGDVFFALGLLRDTLAVGPTISRLHLPDSLAGDAVAEAATALARIGGATAAQFIGEALIAGADFPRGRRSQFVPNALLDGWRLGSATPVQAMVRYTTDTSATARWNAVFALGRIRAPGSGQRILNALRDQDPNVRAVAAKSLTQRFVDTTSPRIPANTVKSELARAFGDEHWFVRINALDAAGTFGDSAMASKAISVLEDEEPNARIAAANALGHMGGSQATKALNALFDKRDASWALQEAALLALARADTTIFARRASLWSTNADFRHRIAALNGWAIAAPLQPTVFLAELADADPRVVAAALDTWHTAHPSGDTALVTAARARLHHADPWVRAAAADALRDAATADDATDLVAAWRLSLGDTKTSDARLAVLRTLGALAKRQAGLLARVTEATGGEIQQPPKDPVVRAEAVKAWPELAARWGSKWPIETGRVLEDYRSIVRRYLLADSNPHVTVQIENRGTIDMELLAHEAPLTVANFMLLVERHFFDGTQWHRVVPGFVVQDGDPTGTGNGGPGWAIRDEPNRERYSLPMVGMALDGPDTGGSQWFITLGPEPHLDGVYTIFAQVPTSYGTLLKILQGDVIRSIHR